MTQTTTDEVMEIIQREAMIPPEKMLPSATLDELGVASLDMVSILFAVEDKYGIDIAPEELGGVSTLEQFVAFILTRTGNAAV